MVGKQNYTVQKRQSNRASVVIKVILSLLFVVIVTFGISTLYGKKESSVIPQDIKSQISNVVFYPSTNSGLTVDKTSFKFDPSSKVFSFTAKFAQADMTIAEQATPENFVDIPQAYDKLIETLNEYSSFNSFYDTVHLTKPKENKGQQSAVMNSKGTLMFFNVTSGSLTEDEWKKLFNNLEVIR